MKMTTTSTFSTNKNATAKSLPLRDSQLKSLQAQGFTPGLALSLNDVKEHFPLRIWVVDNSRSMRKVDGHRILSTSTTHHVQSTACSRWDELSSCVEYHMRLAASLEAPTRFRLLNGLSSGVTEFSLTDEDKYKEVDEIVRKFKNLQPQGATPLTQHIYAIKNEIEELAPNLQQAGQRVCVVLATDGIPTDSKGRYGTKQRNLFVEALRSLEGLPVWVVLRLCTDEDRVVSFWNDIDSILELDIDVLDDFTAEAKEVAEFNPWINYSLPLHRLREFGNHDRLYDLIDERAFTKSEIRDFCATILGDGSFDGLPDPNLDWNGFLNSVGPLVEKQGKIWNPLRARPKKWLSTNTLRRVARFQRWK